MWPNRILFYRGVPLNATCALLLALVGVATS